MDSTTAELLFREMISVNLLSVNVAISDWCAELAQQISVCRSCSADVSSFVFQYGETRGGDE